MLRAPALSREEQVHRYWSPTAGFGGISYNGSGLMGREVDTIRSCIAYDEGHLIGVLAGTGGLADHIYAVLDMVSVRDTSAEVITDDDPIGLLDRLIAANGRGVRQRRPGREPMRGTHPNAGRD